MELQGLFSVLAAFVVAVTAVRLTRQYADRWGLVDEANHRSLHKGRKPRTGGLGILAGIGIGWAIVIWLIGSTSFLLVLLAGGGVVVCVSILDDFYDTSPLLRLIIHFLAGIAPLLGGFGLEELELPGIKFELGAALGALLTILFVVWFVNLYNFMDGMDGFSGGMALIGFGSLAVLGFMSGEIVFSISAAVVASSSAGFLIFNFPPARVFMGDTGAAPLGYWVAGFGLWADAVEIAPLWVTVMIFSPFFLDATVTAACRVLRKERFWEAHKKHYYQRSVDAGWSHKQTVLVEYALMLGCGISASLILDAVPWVQWSVVLIWFTVFFICGVGVNRREARSEARV